MTCRARINRNPYGNLVFLRRFLMLKLRLAHSRLPAGLVRDPVDCSEQACFASGLACNPAGSPRSEKTRFGCARRPRWGIPGFCDILSRFASFCLTRTPILPYDAPCSETSSFRRDRPSATKNGLKAAMADIDKSGYRYRPVVNGAGLHGHVLAFIQLHLDSST